METGIIFHVLNQHWTNRSYIDTEMKFALANKVNEYGQHPVPKRHSDLD